MAQFGVAFSTAANIVCVIVGLVIPFLVILVLQLCGVALPLDRDWGGGILR